MLVGAVKLGAWVIFDEVNRIQPETMSIVSEFIYIIQTAMKNKVKNNKIVLAGKECVVNDLCHIYITLNPNYVGKC